MGNSGLRAFMVWLVENSNIVPIEKLLEVIRIVMEVREEMEEKYTMNCCDKEANYLSEIRDLIEDLSIKIDHNNCAGCNCEEAE